MIYRIATIDEILPLRRDVLRPGKSLEEARFNGDDDPRTVHFVAIEEEKVVGCLSMMVAPWEGREAWQLRGMAVSKESRGTGVGATLLEMACMMVLVKEDLHAIWCNARTEAVGFYKKQGWKTVGDEFAIEGVGPHYKMIRAVQEE
jgi:predicted GNAT family N-acyltransferase